MPDCLLIADFMGVLSALVGELLIKICIPFKLGWYFIWILNTLATPGQGTKQGTYLETNWSRLKFPLLSHAWSPPKLQYSAGTNLSLRALWVFRSACFHSLPNPKLIFWAILVNHVIQKQTITYTNMTEGSLWPQVPIFPPCRWTKSYLHDKDVSIEQISPCLEFPCGPLITLNAALFRCALLHTTQCSSDPRLWRGDDRLITPNTEFLMSHYGLPFSASGSISANRLNGGSARSRSAMAKYLAQILHLRPVRES